MSGKRSAFGGAIIWPLHLLVFMIMWPVENTAKLSASSFLSHKEKMDRKTAEIDAATKQLESIRKEAELELGSIRA